MKTILISEFKAKAIRCLKDVNEKREPLQVSIRGVPLAVIYPADTVQAPQVKLGSGAGFRVKEAPEPDWFGTDFASEWEGSHGPVT